MWLSGRHISKVVCVSIIPEDGSLTLHLLFAKFFRIWALTDSWMFLLSAVSPAILKQTDKTSFERSFALPEYPFCFFWLVQGVVAPAVMMTSFTWGLKLPTAVSAGSSGGKSGAIKASVDKACRSGSYKEVWPYFVGARLLSITITALDENILPFFFFFTSKDLTSTGWDYF